MRRLAFLLVLVPSSLFAAPVPIVPRADPFAAGMIPRAELDRLPFPARALHGPTLPEPAAIALHVPSVRFKSGEPIPAYFVVRNATDKRIGLDLRLDSFRERVRTYNSAQIDLRDLSTGKPVANDQSHVWACGWRSPLELERNGYYVARGDLSPAGLGFLPPGEYEVSWKYQTTRSNTVRFCVTGPPAKAVRPPRTNVQFVQVQQHSDVQEKLVQARENGGTALHWSKVNLGAVDPGHFGAWLGTGIAGKHYPNVGTLPQSDGRVRVQADWYFSPKGDSVLITLVSSDPKKPASFDDYPRVFLQVESEGSDDFGHEPAKQKLAELRQVEIATPLTVRIDLPKNWRKGIGASGPGRVAVVVTSEDVPHWGEKEKLRKKSLRADDTPPWSGVLRSEFVPIEFPKVAN